MIILAEIGALFSVNVINLPGQERLVLIMEMYTLQAVPSVSIMQGKGSLGVFQYQLLAINTVSIVGLNVITFIAL